MTEVIDPVAVEARAIRTRLDVLGGPTPAGAALVERLVDSFLTRAPAYLVELDAAVRRRDAAEVARVAHSLAGVAGNLGAAGLAGMCERLEVAEADEYDDLLAGVRITYAGVRRVFAEMNRFDGDSHPASNPDGPS
jgi:HPt (histidine-containing phosphotransfer) domain-containing protein